MVRKSLVKLSMVTMALVAVCSCGDKDLYDRDAYLNQVKQAFPVNDIDPQHDWSSVATVRLTARLSMNKPGTYMVHVYSAMPQSGQNTELLASAEVANGGVFTTNLNYRVNSPMLYIAVEDEREAVVRRRDARILHRLAAQHPVDQRGLAGRMVA